MGGLRRRGRSSPIPQVMNATSTTPRLLRVASFVNSAQADLARMQLAMEDIPAFLGNAAFVTWFWHYSNATGGAKVFVSSSDAERAVAVLRPLHETAPAVLPPWKCLKCRQNIDADWKTCWHCGAAMDGEEDPNFLNSRSSWRFPWSSLKQRGRSSRASRGCCCFSCRTVRFCC